MLTLLERGDVEGRYQSRSEAVMATAVAAVNAGWDEETWRHVLRDGPLNHWADTQIRKTGARRSRRGHDTERRLHTTWLALSTGSPAVPQHVTTRPSWRSWQRSSNGGQQPETVEGRSRRH